MPLNPWTSKMSGYKSGQNVACKVVRAEQGGYEVRTTKDNLPGFLQTEARLRDNEEVLAQFVCVQNNRVLLSVRMAGSTLNSPQQYKPAAQTNWQQQLENPNGPQGSNGGEDLPMWTNQETTVPVFKLRRAIDLILPSITEDKGQSMRIGDEDVEWLITDLEGGMRTGCMKALCEPRKSRSAVLLYRGRAVGCIYGNKTLPEPQPTEPSLQMMLNDLNEPETTVLIYDLPEEVTLAMSALFLGYPVERNDDLDGRSYLDYIGSWLQQKEQTACLAINTSAGATCLAFVCKGRYVGAFYVEDQKFDPNIQFVFDLLNGDRDASVSATILPPELTSSSVRFGFSLSMARKNASGAPGNGLF